MHAGLTLIGRLGNEPEMRYTQSGVPVTSFRMVTTNAWNDDQGQRHEENTWWQVSCWRKAAEIAAQFLHKGDITMVWSTKISAHGYTNRDGQVDASLQVTAEKLTLLPNARKDGSAQQGTQQNQQSGGWGNQNNGGGGWGNNPGSEWPRSEGAGDGGSVQEEDIPF